MQALLITAAALAAASQPGSTAVDLGRYQGTWYEIAAKPQAFESGCACAQAVYELVDGFEPVVNVTNSCWRGGVRTDVSGIARVLDRGTNAQLSVQFPGSPAGAYNIVALDQDYRFAVIEGSDQDSVWILFRERKPTPELLGAALAAASSAVDLAGLRFTPQSSCADATASMAH